MRIVFAGTRGVPARYGGFETAIEEIGSRLVAGGHDVVVMCRNPGQTETEYKGMKLVNGWSIKRKSFETLSHSLASLPAIVRAKPDVVIFFNVANAVPALLLKLVGIRYAIHVDGIEWQRSKWGPVGKIFFRFSEWLSVVSCRWLIADASGISDYYAKRFGKSTELISYGAPSAEQSQLARNVFGLTPRAFYLVVARLEPENNVHVILEGYAKQERKHPIVVVGSAPYGDRYLDKLRQISPAASMVGAVYDQAELDWMYANSLAYIHGHSVGGTNPSLLRGGGVGVPDRKSVV